MTADQDQENTEQINTKQINTDDELIEYAWCGEFFTPEIVNQEFCCEDCRVAFFM